MRLGEKYGGIQFFAIPNIGDLIVAFDSHITKVSGGKATWDTSGTSQAVQSFDGLSVDFTVELEAGYIIDSVTVSDGTESFDVTETTFKLIPSGGAFDNQTLTITSKYVGGHNNEEC